MAPRRILTLLRSGAGIVRRPAWLNHNMGALPQPPPADLRTWDCVQCAAPVAGSVVHFAPDYVAIPHHAPLCVACWHALVEADWELPARPEFPGFPPKKRTGYVMTLRSLS